jgi:hypothetical protein
MLMPRMLLWFIIAAIVMMGHTWIIFAQEPPAINPFGTPPQAQRQDAVPGYVELSDGSIYPGRIYLTRDKALKIYDEQLQRQREIPLGAVKQIQGTIKKEWLEKEWKFAESAKDEKLYTGRSYPAREYVHTITLKDGRIISGSLSAIVYVQSLDSHAKNSGSSMSETKAQQFILHKRDKGAMGQDLQSLLYVKLIKLGKEAYEEGKQKAAEHRGNK